MQHTIEFVDSGVEDVVVRTSGRGRLSGFTAYLDELVADERFQAGMAILVDHTDLDPSGLVTDDARALAAVVGDMRDRVGGTALACVAPTAVMYGLCRAFEAYSESSGVRSRVFSSAAEARAWLAEAKPA